MYPIKTILSFILVLTSFFNINAFAPLDSIIEPAILRVVYQRRIVTDTLDRENDYSENMMTLKIGKTVSAFFNEKRKTSDSIEYWNIDYFKTIIRDRKLFRELAMLPKEAIFKNYPESKIRTHERFDLTSWIIDEVWEKPEWRIYPDSIATFLNYDCIMATTEFRGRNWRVFFSPEIPISDGPWKLCGLPGIILFAQDSRHDYTYEAIALENENIGNVEYFDYSGNRLKTSREKALVRKRKSLQEDIAYKIRTSGMYGLSSKNVKKRDKIPHKNYDFEETDYPHK